MKRNIPPYKVLLWDVNRNTVEYYDVMPYLVNCWKEDKKRKVKVWGDKQTGEMPKTFDEFKTFVTRTCRYMFWSRCEYEVLVTAWPTRIPKTTKEEILRLADEISGLSDDESKNKLYEFTENKVYSIDFEKIDAYDQIEANIDVLTTHFMNYINS